MVPSYHGNVIYVDSYMIVSLPELYFDFPELQKYHKCINYIINEKISFGYFEFDKKTRIECDNFNEMVKSRDIKFFDGE